MVKYFLVYLVLLISSCFAAELDPYYSNLLGEKDTPLYYGKFFPKFNYGHYMGMVENIDDEANTRYQYNSISTPLYDLNNYLRTEFTSGALCPNILMAEHIDYIQYSYRLISLSYLFEAIIHYDEVSKDLRGLGACKTNVKKLIQKCRPVSAEMKHFKTEAIGFTKNILEMRRESKLSKKKYKKVSELSKSSDEIYGQRLSFFCELNNCSGNFSKDMNRVCEYDKKIFTQICSENDRLLGMTFTSDPYHLLSRSNIVNNFNDMGYALGCMRRYSQMMKYRESSNSSLAHLFPVVREKLQDAHGERFLQGMLFIPGALKEFRDKGLKQIFTQKEMPKVERPTIIAAVKPKKAPRPVMPKKEVVKLVVKKKVVVKKAPPKDERSAFKQAVELLTEFQLDHSAVDMLKFKYDYVFTKKMKTGLEAPLKKFMAQKSIKEMKKFDGLGSKKGPVPLLFLKYMIDTNEHQGLHNLKLILGDKFFVKNNIDKNSNEVNLIKLENNAQTNYQWQISIIQKS